MRVWAATLLFFAGLMGASGVGLAAYAVHQSAGETLSIAAMFLLIHAAAVSALALGGEERRGILIAATLLAIGAHLFSGSITLHMLAGMTSVTRAAPIGGMTMIAGWLVLAIAAIGGRIRYS